MQCPICQFENMPGQARCARCNAQLVAARSVPGEFMPPRAGWLRSLRPLQYAAARLADRFDVRAPAWLRPLLPDVPWLSDSAEQAIVCSAVPGFGHLVDGRPRAAVVAFVVWLGLMLAMFAVFPTWVGAALFGVVLGWHAAVAYDAGRVWVTVRQWGQRLRIMGLIVAALGTAYLGANFAVAHYTVFVRCPVGIPVAGLERDDLLLVRRIRGRMAAPPTHLEGERAWWGGRHSWAGSATEVRRHDVVTARVNWFRRVPGAQAYMQLHMRGNVPMFVLGLPGDTVEVGPTGAWVGGVFYAARQLSEPVAPEAGQPEAGQPGAGQPGARQPGARQPGARQPGALDGVPLPVQPAHFRFRVPAGSVLAVYPIAEVRGVHGAPAPVAADVLWRYYYVFALHELDGRAVAVYMPFGRQRWL